MHCVEAATVSVGKLQDCVCAWLAGLNEGMGSAVECNAVACGSGDSVGDIFMYFTGSRVGSFVIFRNLSDDYISVV